MMVAKESTGNQKLSKEFNFNYKIHFVGLYINISCSIKANEQCENQYRNRHYIRHFINTKLLNSSHIEISISISIFNFSFFFWTFWSFCYFFRKEIIENYWKLFKIIEISF